MNTKFEMTRRSAIASMGASAILAANPALAASASSTDATTEAVTVVWPAYHSAGSDRPQAGEPVILRVDREPHITPALSIYSQQGLKLGYVAPRKAEKLLAALEQGARLDVRIGGNREEISSHPNEAGWHVATLSVTTERPRSFV